MNRDDIIRMAQNAGLERIVGVYADGSRMVEVPNLDLIKRFANLIAAAEREACAKICDEHCNPNSDESEPVTQYQSGAYITAEFLAAAIRARGQS